MKKIILLFILLTVSFGYSQNLALSGATDSSSGASALAVDGDMGSRWESAFTDTEWWSVDLGASYDIGQVKIFWEGAYGDQYTIDISSNNVDWTTIYTEASGNGGTDDLSVSGTGRYVRYNGTHRALPYGHSFWEFEVYEAVDPLEDATLSDLTVDGVTVDGFSAGTLTYNIELPYGTVTVPTIVGTPTQTNPAVAVTEDAVSLPGTSTVLVTAQDGSTTETYTLNFTIAPPPVTLPLDFSDASQAFTWDPSDPDPGGTALIVSEQLQISGNGNAWDNAFITFSGGDVVDLSDDAANTITFTMQSTTALVGEVHTHLLKLSTTLGVNEQDFTTTGQEVKTVFIDPPALGDLTELRIFVDRNSADNGIYLIDDIAVFVPSTLADATLSDLTVDGVTVDGFSAGTLTYNIELPNGTVTVPTVVGTPTQSNPAVAVTEDAVLLPGTSTVDVTAQDGSTTQTYTLNFTVAGPPVVLPLDFSDASQAFTGIGGADTSLVPDPDDGANDVLKIVGPDALWDNAEITFTTPVDLSNSAMNTISFKFRTDADYGNRKHLMKFIGGSGGGADIELFFELDAGTGWQTISLDADDAPQFNGAVANFEKLLLFTDAGDLNTGTYYFDDIEVVPTPIATCDDGIQNGDETGVDCGGSCDACPATCDDGIQNGDETGVDCGGASCAPCVALAPTIAAPTPAEDPADVISVFTTGVPYTDISPVDYNPNWTQATVTTEVSIAGNNTLKYENLNYQGTDFSDNRQDVTGMDFIHVDYWTPFNKVLQFSLINHADNGGGEQLYDFATDGGGIGLGTWVSVDIPLTHYSGLGLPLNQIYQFKFVGDGTVFIDNLYFWDDTSLGINDFDITDFSIYPNPTQDSWTVKTKNQNITAIQVFDLLGKKVVSITPNSSEAKIDASRLTSGIYLARINTVHGVNSVKLVKQ